MLHIVRKPVTTQFKTVSPLSMATNTPTILNGPTSRNPLDLSQLSMGTRQLVHLYLTVHSTIKLSANKQQQQTMMMIVVIIIIIIIIIIKLYYHILASCCTSLMQMSLVQHATRLPIKHFKS
jgi:hypothetical protein